VILGGLALRGLSGVSFFALISGLGYSFESGSLSRRLLRFVVSGFYRFSLGVAKGVIFQNSDNMELFISQGLAHASKCSVVDGSGVDLIRFRPTALPDGAPVFLLIARLIGDKGLREYAHAARIVKARHPNVRFRLLGPTDPSPDSVPLDEVQAWDTEKLLEYLGSAHDVRPSIADCHVYVLPSYHEGIPRTVLEAMAMARPILTTDVPGCRETVVAGKNGHLVPKADARALAEKLIWFIEHRDHWADMGQYSRQLAEERFDVRKINSEMMRIMNLVCIEA
jgi:glycosyltransferase involved in cell wall biosynthesis